VEGKKESLFTVKDGQYFCPLCGAEIYWACSGDTGWAHCANSMRATRSWDLNNPPIQDFCGWSGRTRRRLDGKVEIFYYP